ncbi:hypothetical protein DICVIV_04689 [Dictyocaulus viviparus]|uniref:C2H2-type domain-containing protein n=1 Tax=Dictyocaulus viviparus TaxID=29172 RepID=A0A0D8XX28_DICVI|nr:hypothetical protein DICVIV_04689 [Dictyocaulus viviparus]
MDESYIQLLAAAAAAMPLSPFISNNTTLVGQQAMATSPYSLLQNHWLQQQYYQQLALQYLDNIRACSTLTSPFSATSIATLPLSSDTVKDNSSIADAGVTVMAPVPKRPRLMLPVVNEEQLLDVQQSQTNEKSAVVVVDQPQPFAFLSTASAACRTSTLSPTTETSAEARCSSSASVDTASNPKEEEEPELFVDIESVDNRPEGRDRRRAYIEFYRKVKSARQREPGSLLSCALCDCQVLSNDNSIHAHVNHHADAGGFWCKLCGVNEVDKYRIYEHMRVYHPNNMELFEDRRDITKLCAVIQECFPRTCPRSKKEVVRGVDNLIKHIEDNKIAEVKCERCDAVVKATKAALTKHAHQHPMYRCKVCKFMAEDLKTQEEHQVELHSVLDPKNVVDYNVCVAADVLARVVQRCFAYILQSNDSKSVDSKN